MIALLKEMIARFLGKRQEQPIRVHLADDNPLDRIFKGPK